MSAHLDELAPGKPVDPLCLAVRGWVWLGVDKSELADVEAWRGDALPAKRPRAAAQPDRAIRIDRRLK